MIHFSLRLFLTHSENSATTTNETHGLLGISTPQEIALGTHRRAFHGSKATLLFSVTNRFLDGYFEVYSPILLSGTLQPKKTPLPYM